ncbi:probable plastid-lipid-associated protein 10, chloroplastic [Vitis riparia]|uniref:probable plastid-lipid-associated protein 10, chloroplastic n=1 Tax=Vitis riparia TaxID=96939 RepID=UPI00155A8943|nr:probable plastid-lipid-associated protein 10, chloroplastic [Vitis riparia]XP_034709862.1 probable plastid-lipid-associated protein 10, chloroplastic [Vitis riparia]XP_034709863.1 probable plastid-lipid-associated protein 10, chloroplastic [Vitis riparia]XP_034709864.1 probable plastid-lipid-associated protein 10, chloroplastic [Vitis riparia]
MNLAFASTLHLPTGQRVGYDTRPVSLAPNVSRALSTQKMFPCLAATATPTTQAAEFVLEEKKHDLLRAIQDTQRGLVATADQRSCIEEALVNVEEYNAGAPIDLGKLDGTWRLQYTSAPDVLVLLESAARFSFFQVGQIFQKFECQNQSKEGVVRNVVRWSIPPLLEEQEGATLLVSAKFSVVSARNIYLQFEEISIQNINISEELQALIAPAILPRSFLSLQILQFIRTFKAEIPVRNQGRRSVGGLYYLSYLDANMLLGRAAAGGIFVFTRAQPLV